jgi:hypothetical protein
MSKHIFLTKGTLLGTIAKYAVSQSPYAYPEHLEIVLYKLNAFVEGRFKESPMRVAEFADDIDLLDFLHIHLAGIPEYIAWNERKNGRESEFAFVSRYDGEANPDDDFIDLDALERNVVTEIEREV